MLSEQNRPIVEATLPVVGEHIGEIAGRFYEHLFAAHPELLDGTFNRGNQTSGEQQQALAGSVAAFASALVTTPEHLPENLLSRIAHKHASLGITPRPVPGRPRQPDVGDRRRARRRRHPGGRRRLGRGLLADGQRADQPGARALQRPRRPTGDRVAPVAGRAEDPGDRRRRDLRRQADRRPAGQDFAARPVRHRADADARRRPPAPPVQPHPGRRRRAPPVLASSGCTAAASPTARCRPCCTTRSTSATC